MRRQAFTEDWLKERQGVRGNAGAGQTMPEGSRTALQTTRQSIGAATGIPRFKSKWELQYSKQLELEKQAGMIRQFWYEPFSLWLPGKVRYKPDFLIQYPDGLEKRLEVIEVKGWSKNRRDGMTRLKIAAALFPCFTWRLVRWTGRGFDGEYV